MNQAIEFIGKIIEIKIDRPIRSKHPKYSKMVYPINYGYVPNTTAPDGEEIDAYLLGVSEPVKKFKGKCIAVIHRTNDNDDKLIVVPENADYTDKEILTLTKFQEQYFKSKVIRKKP